MLAVLALIFLPARIHLEAESGRLEAVHVAHDRAGFTGTGYVTGFQTDQSRVVLTFPAEAGIYELHLRFSSPSGEKGYGVKVNGSEVTGLFPKSDQAWHDADGGRVELRTGSNTLEITKGWGWFDIDSVDLIPAPAPMPLKPPPARLADHHADASALQLYRALLAQYGKRTLSGQYDAQDCDQVNEVTGSRPAILGGDLMDFSPSRMRFGANPAGALEGWVARARAGEIITLSWHWNAPDHLINKEIKGPDGKPLDARWYKGFYTYASTFDVQKALDHPDSNDYKLLISDMDSIAARLRVLQAAGVPVLWRPLHEADGGWFWWGAKGPGAFKRLWRLMFDRFTRHDGLHNLIWVLSAPNRDWYPGDDVVDVYGVDAYPKDPSDPQSATWDRLQAWLNGRKPLALTEFGKVPDVDRAFRFGARWLYFVSWSGDLGEAGMTRDELNRRYHEPHVVNFPFKWKNSAIRNW